MTMLRQSSASIVGIARPRWITATIAACAGHLMIAGAVLSLADAPDLDDEPGGALVLELSPVETSVAATDTNLPLGPQSVDSAASVPQVAADVPPPEPEATELAPLPPAEVADIAQPQQQPEKPVEQPIEKVEQAQPVESSSDYSEASRAAAPQAFAAPIEAKSAAPVVGSSKQATQAKLTWHKAIAIHLNRHKQFPKGASDAGGEALVSFTIDRSGRVLSSTLVRSAGAAAFDAEADALLKRASPLPRPSIDVPGETFTLVLPIVFRKKG